MNGCISKQNDPYQFVKELTWVDLRVDPRTNEGEHTVRRAHRPEQGRRIGSPLPWRKEKKWIIKAGLSAKA